MRIHSARARFRLVSILLAFVALVPGWATADGLPRAFEQIVVFGDSLSDNGNQYKNTGQPPSPPYYNGRFSNGPTWSRVIGPATM